MSVLSRRRVRPAWSAAGTLLLAAAATGSSPAPGAAQLPELPVERVRLLQAETLEGGAELSPNGRWLAYSTGTLHLLPMEDGERAGDPVELVSPTTGEPIEGAWPQWPSDDVLLFTDGIMYRMRLDPAVGRVTDAPRRVSIDDVFRRYALSPGRDSVAYVTRAGEGRYLRIMPGTGGTTVDVAGPAPIHGAPAWDDDGFIYYSLQRQSADPGTTLHRVRPGGEPEPIRDFVGTAHFDMEAGVLVHPLCFNRWLTTCGETRVATLDGVDRGTVETFRAQVAGGAGGDLLVTAYDVRIATYAVELGNGDPVTLSSEAMSWVDGWLDDGSPMYSVGSKLWTADPEGDEARELDLETDIRVAAIDGRWLLYATDVAEDRSIVKVRDLATGRDRVLSERGTWTRTGGQRSHVRGRGGYHRRDGGRFLYSTERAGVQTIWSVTPEGEPERLWDFPEGERFVYTVVFDDWLVFGRDGRLMVATPGWSEPRVFYEPSDGSYANGAVWSRDGRRMVANVGGELRLLEVDFSGGVPSANLLPDELSIPDGFVSDYLWAADDRALVVLTVDDNDRSSIWHLDLSTGRASEVADAPGVWELRMSPDGSRVSYTSGWSEGAELWRLTIGGLGALEGVGRR